MSIPIPVRELMAIAWDEGFKQGGPMHDVNFDDPDAHTRNPYRKLPAKPIAYRWTQANGEVFVIDPREIEIVYPKE